MRLGIIDFPPELIAAIRDGDLVIFAGAGVSKGAPANLPLFNELADKIADGSGEKRSTDEAIDQFLGRLASQNGIKVNKIAAHLLTETNPQPTQLHCDLLRLSKGDPNAVRLVTTNFDLLFEAAAVGLFHSKPTVFRASALPRGDEFAGIVHVHGDVTIDTDMVLTDADFGRAYLMGGWARRFLVGLFQTKPVLFVGYSHSDTIMEYLARAMPVSTPPRFILTDEKDAPRWKRLSLQPIMFPKGDFDAQNQGIAKLAAAVNRGASDWSDWIRNAARSRPAVLSDENADVLSFGLTEAIDSVSNTCVFIQNAHSFEWVTWLAQRGHLDPLFDRGQIGEKDRIFASWIASNFARSNAEQVFRLIGQKDLRLSPDFWRQLTWEIGSGDKTSITSENLGRWVSLLLTKYVKDTYDGFHHVLERCVELDRLDDALDILDAVAEPRIHRISLGMEESVNEVEIRIREDAWRLARMRSALQPHLSRVAERLIQIANRHLSYQHRHLVTWGLANRNFSQPSIHREKIGVDVDPEKLNSEDVLVDLARDSLVWLARNNPKQAEAWIGRFSTSDVPLLRRLAVFALTELQE